MSTGLNCMYFEDANGKWYYVLERGCAPKEAWDWTEYADVVGPFVSFDAANKYLHENNANPGGYSKFDYHKENNQKKHNELIARSSPPKSDGLNPLLKYYRFRY